MDPRIAKTRRSVIDAATDLLVEGGPDALTMDAVVARSGVAKSTLYRHWATRDDLVATVFQACAPDLEVPPDGASFADALHTTVRSVARSFSDERWIRLLPTLLLLSRRQADLADIDHELKKEQFDLARRVLALGVEEGELRPEVLDDLDRTLALLIGPFMLRGLSDPTGIDDAFADACADQFVAGHRPVTVGSPT